MTDVYPDVAWTPNPPGIRLYNASDWAYMDNLGMGWKTDEHGGKYVSFPINSIRLKEIYGSIQIPKTPLRRRLWEKLRDRLPFVIMSRRAYDEFY